MGDLLDGMNPEKSKANLTTSSSNDERPADSEFCKLCGGEPICGGLGMIRYNVPVDHPYFGKLFRCPNHHVELDVERKEKLFKLSNLVAHTDKTFQTFTISQNKLPASEAQSLQDAYDVASFYAQQGTGWLVIAGRYGCGKTHLAAAIANHRLERGESVLFITAADLLDHLRATFAPTSDSTYDELFDRLRNAPLLVLDDLGAENQSQWAQEKLFQLLDHRYTYRLSTVITTNLSLDNFEGRIRSRLLDAALVQQIRIEAPDYRIKMQFSHDRLLSSLSMYKHMTFKNFDTTQNVTYAEEQNLTRIKEEAQKFARKPDSKWFALVSEGPACGKTHLAAAIGNHLQEHNRAVIFITVPDLLDYLRETFSPTSRVGFDQRFYEMRNAPLLILDDMSMESATTWTKEKLFQLLDYRYVSKLSTVITAPKSILDNERIASRLYDNRVCAICELTARDYPRRMNSK
jgi:DNA replication protein DnaC